MSRVGRVAVMSREGDAEDAVRGKLVGESPCASKECYASANGIASAAAASMAQEWCCNASPGRADLFIDILQG